MSSSKSVATFGPWVMENKAAFSLIPVDQLEEAFFISSYSKADPESNAPQHHGYQRDPMDQRFRMIAKYYLEGNQELITPIIVSVRISDKKSIEEFISLVDKNDFAAIKNNWNEAVMSIVDGQHRYGGLIQAHKTDNSFKPLVPVMMYFGLDYSSEAQLFDVINTTQRKLPKALIEVNQGDIVDVGKSTHAQRVREIAFGLARDKDSVWFEDINMTGARDPNRKITYEGLRRSTSNMFPNEVIARIESRGESPLGDYAKPFWDIVSKACYTSWAGGKRAVKQENGETIEEEIPYRIKELVGVASLAKLGKDIILTALDMARYNKPQDTIVDFVSKLSAVDWEKSEHNVWMRSQAGFAGQKDLYNTLYKLVYSDELPDEEID